VLRLREPAVKLAGKPDAVNPHVRFDERGSETDYSAPILDSTWLTEDARAGARRLTIDC